METGQHECEHEDQVGQPDARHHRAQERYEDKMKIVRKYFEQGKNILSGRKIFYPW